MLEKLKTYFSQLSTTQIAFLMTVSAVAVIGLSWLGLSVFNNRQPTDSIKSDEETREILTDVLGNNSAQIIDTPDRVDAPSDGQPSAVDQEKTLQPSAPVSNVPKPQVSTSGKLVLPQKEKIFLPAGANYNYRVTKLSTAAGPKSDQCVRDFSNQYYSDLPLVGQNTTRYEFMDTKRSYFKWEAKNSTNTVLREEFAKYDYGSRPQASAINYQGGKIHAVSRYDVEEYFGGSIQQPTSYANEIPVSYAGSPRTHEQTVLGYFGQNARIIADFSEGSQKYWSIAADDVIFCDFVEDVEDLTYARSAIIVYKVRQSDSSIVSKSYYFDGEVKPETLAYTMNVSTEYKKISFTDVENTFKYSRDTTAVVVDYRNTQSDIEGRAKQIVEYMRSSNIPFAQFGVQGFDVSYMYSSNLPEHVKNEKYWTRRDFYGTDAYGEKQFQLMQKKQQRESLVSLAYEFDKFFLDERSATRSSYYNANINGLYGPTLEYFNKNVKLNNPVTQFSDSGSKELSIAELWKVEGTPVAVKLFHTIAMSAPDSYVYPESYGPDSYSPDSYADGTSNDFPKLVKRIDSAEPDSYSYTPVSYSVVEGEKFPFPYHKAYAYHNPHYGAEAAFANMTLNGKELQVRAELTYTPLEVLENLAIDFKAIGAPGTESYNKALQQVKRFLELEEQYGYCC